jgi:hypothetical protein
MAKMIVGLALYAIAFAALYTAFDIAPDMTWPRTDAEFLAAQLLVIGGLAKCFGLAVILSPSR